MREIFYPSCFLSPGAVSASGGGEDSPCEIIVIET